MEQGKHGEQLYQMSQRTWLIFNLRQSNLINCGWLISAISQREADF